MSWIGKLLGRAPAPAPEPAARPAPAPPYARLVESASPAAQEAGWRRLSGDGPGGYNERDLTPMDQRRMQKLAEHLWQRNVLANRLIELPLAYLLAEGVTMQAADEQQQAVLDRFWYDPINNWPAKLEARVRALALLGEQCYTAHVGPDGMVRLGYLDPRRIAQVVLDPDNPEQPIGVVTQRDARGRHYKYRVIVLGEDAQVFSHRTAQIRQEDFSDGECFLLQINKFPDGSRGRSDLLGQMDWLDAYDEFLFSEIDRIGDLRRFVWDVTMTGADQDAVDAYQKQFIPPSSNSAFVHNDTMSLEPKSPALHAADTSESARLLRNHVLGGSTFPEHWFGGGADANRAIGESMTEPTFKMYTLRQSRLKLFLEEIGRYVLWKSSQQAATPDWSDPRWHVTAVFPELASRDVTKFAAALQSVVAAVLVAIDRGLLTEETALKMVADVAGRFGQEIDPASELDAARAAMAARQADAQAEDMFAADPDSDADAKDGAP